MSTSRITNSYFQFWYSAVKTPSASGWSSEQHERRHLRNNTQGRATMAWIQNIYTTFNALETKNIRTLTFSGHNSYRVIQPISCTNDPSPSSPVLRWKILDPQRFCQLAVHCNTAAIVVVVDALQVAWATYATIIIHRAVSTHHKKHLALEVHFNFFLQSWNASQFFMLDFSEHLTWMQIQIFHLYSKHLAPVFVDS